MSREDKMIQFYGNVCLSSVCFLWNGLLKKEIICSRGKQVLGKTPSQKAGQITFTELPSLVLSKSFKIFDCIHNPILCAVVKL